jgi:spermidine synthase
VGHAQPLFGEPFYRNVLRVLNPGGAVVSQGESPFYEAETQRAMLRVLHGVFEHTHIYNFPNLTYPGGFWSFTFASQGLCPLEDFDPGRVAASGIHFRYYSQDIHRAAFALPAFMKDEVQEYLSPHR